MRHWRKSNKARKTGKIRGRAGGGITLVLGGLGTKGQANIGVLQALIEYEIPIKRIVATAVSAIIGAYWGLGGDLDELVVRFKRFFEEHQRYLWEIEQPTDSTALSRRRRLAANISYFLRESLFCKANLQRLSVLSWEPVEVGLRELFGDATTDELQVPLAVSAIDLRTGRELLLQEGRLCELVQIGLAIPGLFPPVRMNGRSYVSSVLYSELPLESAIARRDFRPILAIDIPTDLSARRVRSLLELLAQVDELRSITLKEELLKEADAVLRLERLKNLHWGSYRRLEQFVFRAHEETAQALEGNVLKNLSKRSWWR